jgi:hypothetical protein
VRFIATDGTAAEFASVDAGVLGNVDVVVARDSALLELGEEERAALETAVRYDGVGLLLVGEPVESAAKTLFADWQFRLIDRSEGGEDGEETRITRLRLRDGTEIDEPVSVLSAEMSTTPQARWLLRDPQGRTLGATSPLGRGWVARSLVTGTWRWLQHGHLASYASYWSAVLTAISRPVTESDGRWNLDHGTGPIFPGDPVRLSLMGTPTRTLPEAEVREVASSNASPVRLNLAREPGDPARRHAIYWPARPGWHEVLSLPSGARKAFHVQPPGALPALRAARRRDATARLAGSSVRMASRTHGGAGNA